MRRVKLLPRWTRMLGLAMIIPCVIAFVRDPEIVFGESAFNFLGDVEGVLTVKVFAFLDQSSAMDDGEFTMFSMIENDIINEILLTLMLIGTYLIAFAKVKEEDEFSQQLRMESMSDSLVYNGILFLILSWIFYEGMFLYVLIFQLFSFLLIFSLVFALKIRNHRKLLGNEE